MKTHNLIFKSITPIIAITFATTTIAWSAPDLCLRQQSALERGVILGRETHTIEEGFVFTPSKVIHPGVEKCDVAFERGGRFAKGWAILMDPKHLDFGIWVSAGAIKYDFSRFAITKELARKQRKTPKPWPGLRIRDFKVQLPPEDEERVILISTATQGGFWTGNSAVIKDGRLITKTAPGLFQKTAVPLNGDFYFFVLDGGEVEMKMINIKDGEPTVDISDINVAIAGPPLVQHGEDQSGKIKYPVDDRGKGQPVLGPYDVSWDPNTTTAAFIALGRDAQGNLIYIVLSGDPNKQGEVMGREMAEVMKKLGAVEAVLLTGSATVQAYLKDNGFLEAVGARLDSETGRAFPEGRPAASIFYALAKSRRILDTPLPHIDNIHRLNVNWEAGI